MALLKFARSNAKKLYWKSGEDCGPTLLCCSRPPRTSSSTGRADYRTVLLLSVDDVLLSVNDGSKTRCASVAASWLRRWRTAQPDM